METTLLVLYQSTVFSIPRRMFKQLSRIITIFYRHSLDIFVVFLPPSICRSYPHKFVWYLSIYLQLDLFSVSTLHHTFKDPHLKPSHCCLIFTSWIQCSLNSWKQVSAIKFLFPFGILLSDIFVIFEKVCCKGYSITLQEFKRNEGRVQGT